jgi:hypothetical protein
MRDRDAGKPLNAASGINGVWLMNGLSITVIASLPTSDVNWKVGAPH